MALQTKIGQLIFSIIAYFPGSSILLLLLLAWWECAEIVPNTRKVEYIPKRNRVPESGTRVAATIGKIVGYFIRPVRDYLDKWVQDLDNNLKFKFKPRCNTIVHTNYSSPCARPFRMREVKFKHRGMQLTELLSFRDTGYATTVQPLIMANPMFSPSSEKYRTFIAKNEGATYNTNKQVIFDTDSFPIKIDTGCSVSVSGTRSDFIKDSFKAVPKGTVISGYGGLKSEIMHTATILWRIIDDEGRHQDIVIPNSLYVPSCKTRLLSPQHFAQENERKSRTPVRRRATGCQGCNGSRTCMKHTTKCVAYSDRLELVWNNARCRKTANLDGANIATIHSAPGFKAYSAFRDA
jgi:hypothetical protein